MAKKRLRFVYYCEEGGEEEERGRAIQMACEARFRSTSPSMKTEKGGSLKRMRRGKGEVNFLFRKGGGGGGESSGGNHSDPPIRGWKKRFRKKKAI